MSFSLGPRCYPGPGMIWLTVDEGLVRFDGNKFHNAEQNITDKGNYFGYRSIETDNNNTKWVYAGKNIYSYDDKEWKAWDPKEIGIDGAYEIINNPATSEVFFCSDEGLTIYKNGSWSNINKAKVSELPSDRVVYAKRDSKNRIWIGTFSGSVMIDEIGKAVSFENQAGVLKDKCITSMAEDEEGNLYFSLYEFDRKNKKQVNNERAGLVRYDLKDSWENYHSDNSAIPTSYISTMRFDNNGVLYLATRQGLVKVEKK